MKAFSAEDVVSEIDCSTRGVNGELFKVYVHYLFACSMINFDECQKTGNVGALDTEGKLWHKTRLPFEYRHPNFARVQLRRFEIPKSDANLKSHIMSRISLRLYRVAGLLD